jgi:hypothetical protein
MGNKNQLEARKNLAPSALKELKVAFIGYPAAAASNNIKTTANLTATVAAATQPDVARNLRYQMSAASSAVVAGGAVVVYGLDIQGNTRSESVAYTKLAATGTAGVIGTKCFGQINTISISSPSFETSDTDLSAQSSALSLYIGQNERLGLPIFIKQSDYTWNSSTTNSTGGQATTSGSVTGAINRVTVGNGTLSTSARGTQVTAYAGEGEAAIKIASGVAALASNKPVVVHYWANS